MHPQAVLPCEITGGVRHTEVEYPHRTFDPGLVRDHQIIAPGSSGLHFRVVLNFYPAFGLLPDRVFSGDVEVTSAFQPEVTLGREQCDFSVGYLLNSLYWTNFV